MRATTIDLGGSGWTIREALGDTAEWYLGAPLPAAGNNVAEASAAIAAAPGWLPARVPGAVIDDLHRAGELPDPRVGRNSRAAEWVAERSWVYRRAVELPDVSTAMDGEPTVNLLELDGVDPGADVYWDGCHLGSIDGLYRRARLPIGPELLDAGRHKLALRVRPAPQSEPQVGRTERVGVHTPRVGYGWDFSPRLRHQGIWRDVRLRTGRGLLQGVTVRAELVAGDGVVHIGWEAPHTARPGRWRVRVEAAGVTATADAAEGRAELRLRAPELWWPNTFGPQPLYDVEVVLEDERGLADAVCRRVGFRTASLVPNAGAPDGALPYTALVNGVATACHGWNWTPADTLFGSIDPALVEHLLSMAATSGARLMRVWGGGLIESQHFYDTCDRLGLLVWQEFSQSSSGMQSAPSADPAFVELMRREAEAIVPTLTHHPSLLMWGGGNELDEGGVPLSDDRSPVLAALHAVVASCDPGRAWVPTSPTGPEFHNRLDRLEAAPDDQHDVHGPWEHQGLVGQYALANAGTSLAHSEFGVEGMTNLRSLEALVPPADRWPADRTNPVYRHLGEWWNNAGQVVELFGGRPRDLPTLNRSSQLLQATGLQYSVEADRRRFPRCSVVLPWQLNESYPNAWCTAAVDFRGDPKPAFFAVARAFERRRASIRVDRAAWAGEATAVAEVWLWAEDPVAAGSTLVVRALGLDGAEHARVEASASAVDLPMAVARLQVQAASLPTVFMWEAEWRSPEGEVIDCERTPATTTADWAALLDVPQTVLEVVRVNGGGALRIRNVGSVAALTVRVVDPRPAGSPGWLAPGGDPRPLFPGEERTLRSAPGLPARVESWNTAPVDLP